MRRQVYCWALAVAVCHAAVLGAETRKPLSRGQAAANSVTQALQCEVYGANDSRSELLEAAAKKSPTDPAPRWHQGYVFEYRRWLTIDELASKAADDSRLAAYRQMRSRTADTLDGHLALARWCVDRQLIDQQRAHLTRVLELDPDNASARDSLGHRRINGIWVSREERTQVQTQAQKAADSMRRWRSDMVMIREGLNSPNPARRKAAEERLEALRDASVIPAAEDTWGRQSESSALLLVRLLSHIRAPAGSVALARQAAMSEWGSVRTGAVAQLRTRDVQTYVPEVLAAMVSPIESRTELYLSPRGRVNYVHTLTRKGAEVDDRLVITTEYSTGNRTPEAERLASQAGAAPIAGDASVRAQDVEAAVNAENVRISQWNDRLCWVLASAVEKGPESPQPDQWRKWWNDYNEVFTEGANPVRTVLANVTVTPGALIPTRTLGPGPLRTPPVGPTETQPFDSYTPARVTRMECLVAGTLVWTESGPMAIEQIRIGDRVLSQDPQSGALGCKPVLRTTIRQPVPLTKIRLPDQEMIASGGHPFWVAGNGWTRARELTPGQYLHTPTGAIAIEETREEPAQTTYNLVVADYHTYFVGPQKVLSHDNTAVRATGALLPGLMRP